MVRGQVHILTVMHFNMAKSNNLMNKLHPMQHITSRLLFCSHSLGSSRCCRCLGTCQSLRSWPPGPLPPDSCGLPGRGGRSAAMPGTPCLRRSGQQCAASEAVWADPAGASSTPPGYERQGRELCWWQTRNSWPELVQGMFFFFNEVFLL